MIMRRLFIITIALCWPATASIALRGDGLLREVLLISSIPTGSVAVTTFTFENNSGGTLAAGTPVQMGQAFRYGDIPSGYHPVIRDAVTHVALAHQQFDEIDTWRENGGNGSWRHAVWIIDLPSDLANGATYQVEFVPTSGSYSQSPVLALSALCSGVNTHDLKVHLTDLRNQDDTVRGTGEATFRLCDNIANIGRDAPRTLDQGSVRSTFKVLGRFQYTDSSYDPLLYAECNVSLWVDPSTGNSLKDTQWVCFIHNSWMTVAAGTPGHAGNPGPVWLHQRSAGAFLPAGSARRLDLGAQLERSRRHCRQRDQSDTDRRLRPRRGCDRYLQLSQHPRLYRRQLLVLRPGGTDQLYRHASGRVGEWRAAMGTPQRQRQQQLRQHKYRLHPECNGVAEQL